MLSLTLIFSILLVQVCNNILVLGSIGQYILGPLNFINIFSFLWNTIFLVLLCNCANFINTSLIGLFLDSSVNSYTNRTLICIVLVCKKELKTVLKRERGEIWM